MKNFNTTFCTTKNNNLKLIYLPIVLVVILILISINSCVETPRQNGYDELPESLDNSTNNSDNNGKQSTGDNNDNSFDDETTSSNAKVELFHVVDPYTGSYTTKASIPKNYSGKLHIAGINVSSLNDKAITVKFNFGTSLTSVELPALIARGTGITPQTNAELLVIDLYQRPFEGITLPYDLFDYTDYDSDNDGIEELAPTTDPTNSGLYCRGLKLEYDPTYEGSNCTDANSKCLYAYAKIRDSGLQYTQNGSTLKIAPPKEGQRDVRGVGYSTTTSILPLASALKKCLPDNNSSNNLNRVLGGTTDIAGGSTLYFNSPLTVNSTQNFAAYTYGGPFMAINRSGWEISGAAIFSDMTVAGTPPTGIFQKKLSVVGADSDPYNPNRGFRSFLFPRAGKMDMLKDVEYFGSTDPFGQTSSPIGVRTLQKLSSSGESAYIDGCNFRVAYYDSFSAETISSCNITATIEIWAKDLTTKVKTLVTSSRDLKIQLLKPSIVDTDGNEVNYSSFKQCSTSNECGSNECCYNGRCWSNSLVSICADSSDDVGNIALGGSCSTDLECASFCCASGTSKCTTHVNDGISLSLCSKNPGETCISREFCRKKSVRECNIYKVGYNASGKVICNRLCFPVSKFGDCVNGYCVDPQDGILPTFDATADCATTYPNALDLPRQ